MSDEMTNDVRNIVGNIVSAYLSNNQLSADEVPAFIRNVMAALDEGAVQESQPEEQQPAVPIKKSVRKDALTCLECGASQKTMKRHLRVAHDLSPSDYREKWDLPKSYPIVAPSYSETRSAMAKKAGLGRQGKGRGSTRKK